MLKNYCCILVLLLSFQSYSQKEDSILVIPNFIGPDGEFDDDKASSIEYRVQYSALVDLTVYLDNKIYVMLYTPKIKVDTVIFAFKSGVGSISNLTAYAISGKTLKLQKNDSVSWKIVNAKQLKYLMYTVSDTSAMSKPIKTTSLNSFKYNNHYYLDCKSVFGYIQGVKNIPYEINITKQATLFASSASLSVKTSPKLDKFTFRNYSQMVNNAIIYNELKK